MTDISIIVTVFQAELYITQCLNSLLQQNIDNYEIICVDDGSTDNSAFLIKELQISNPIIHYFYQANSGVSAARNFGLLQAQGKYIMFIDSDDYLRINSLKGLLQTAMLKDSDLVIFGGSANTTVLAPEWIRCAFYTRNVFFEKYSPSILYNENGALPSVCNKLFKRSLVSGHLFQESIAIGEDVAFIFEVMPHAHNICFISKRLYVYRINNHLSAMHQYDHNNYKKFNEHLKVMEYIISLISKSKDDLYQEKKYICWFIDYLKGPFGNITPQEKEKVMERLKKISVVLGTNYTESLITVAKITPNKFTYYINTIQYNIKKFGFIYGFENMLSKLLQKINSKIQGRRI